MEKSVEAFGREIGIESDDSDELDQRLDRLIVPVVNKPQENNQIIPYDITKVPEEKNTEKFFKGYNQRIDLITRLKEDL